MKKNKAFTFVELLLVLMILGIIMALTIPIIKNVKDDDDIYRAYMKKANQDVTDAMNMIFIKEPNFMGFRQMPDNAAFTKNDSGLRNAFNSGLNAMECQGCSDTTLKLKCATNGNCIDKEFKGYDGKNISENKGLYIGGKPVMLFQWVAGDDNNENVLNDANGERIYGFVYVDMNKDKRPNEMCKDRYRFIVYSDKIVMDTRQLNAAGDPEGGCKFDLK